MDPVADLSACGSLLPALSSVYPTVHPSPPPPHPHPLPEQQDLGYDLDLRARSAFSDSCSITGPIWKIVRCTSPWLTIPSSFPPSTMRMHLILRRAIIEEGRQGSASGGAVIILSDIRDSLVRKAGRKNNLKLTSDVIITYGMCQIHLFYIIDHFY